MRGCSYSFTTYLQVTLLRLEQKVCADSKNDWLHSRSTTTVDDR